MNVQRPNELIAARKETLKALREHEKALADQLDDIEDIANERDLTQAEIKRLDDLVATMGRVLADMKFIRLAQLATLDNNEKVKLLIQTFQRIKKNLDGDRQRIGNVAEIVENAGKAAEAVEGLLQNLAKAAAKFAG